MIDLSSYEPHGLALKGTGSHLQDRIHQVAFALASQRTCRPVPVEWCRLTGYGPVYLHAYDEDRYPIYHTSVAMAIGEDFAVQCPEMITDDGERAHVLHRLRELDREIIAITRAQVRATAPICCNCAQRWEAA